GAADMLQGCHAKGAAGQNNVWRERNQFCCVSAFAVDIVRTPADVDPHIATISPALLLDAVLECREASLTLWVVGGPVHEYTDAPHPLRLLRARRHRPHNRAAK
ncbi:MAG: hypothetical protein WA669_22970, partial [Pseudolabrys sp.]